MGMPAQRIVSTGVASPGYIHWPFPRESVPATVRRIVESRNKPAYLIGRRRDDLAWNAAPAELFALIRPCDRAASSGN